MPDEDKKPASLDDFVTPVDAPADEATPASAPADTTSLPTKYADKSVEDLVRMHQEAEKAIGRQGSELGEVRRLADQLIQADVNKRTSAEQKSTNEVKLDLDDPDEATRAIQKLVDLRVEEALAGVQGKVQNLEGASLQQRLDREFPDWRDTAGNTEFKSWVDASPVRLRLADEGNAGSYDSSAELFATWKALHPATDSSLGADKDVKVDPDTSRKAALKQATLETGPAATRKSGKVYNRVDLQRLRQKDPDRYDSLRSQIRQAYVDGRVK